MTDLSIVLPGFATHQYVHLIPSLERNLITTTDLLTLDAVDIAKRAKLPLLEVKRLCRHVLQDLEGALGVGQSNDAEFGSASSQSVLRKTGNQVIEPWHMISTLDDSVDKVLRGGVPTGYITEVTGESGAGKTQFLLGLLLATQLPPPHGLSRSAIYISTESALPTNRLSQMLAAHPMLASANPKPSLDRVISIVTPDLESQDHILRYQLPVAISRHNVGLVVLDSVAANYRAEFERPGATKNGANMAKRSSELLKLGQLLRDLSRTEDIAIVVANQVADRFTPPDARGLRNSVHIQQIQSSPLAHRSATKGIGAPAPYLPSSSFPVPPSSNDMSVSATPAGLVESTDSMTLDHQQRWFTGWGDDPLAQDLKTPSLGLIWTTQVACRIAIIKSPVYADEEAPDAEDNKQHERILKKWRRWVKVVFAPWAPPTGPGVQGAIEFSITGAGIRAIENDH